MTYLNHQKNHARKLLGLTLAVTMFISLFAVASYSGTRARPNDVARTSRATSHLPLPQMPGLKANGKIAFVSDRDGNNEIYVMNADGSNQTRFTNNSVEDTQPAWSPDGAKIAFVSQRDDNLEIYVMNADGSNQTRLTINPASDTSPDWSPDGTKIVFIRSSDIVVMNADGSGQTMIRAGDLSGPVWSPDGTRIAFEDNSVGQIATAVFVMNADGSGARRLAGGQDFEFSYSPAWSPDGAKVLFVHDFFLCGLFFAGPCSTDLFVINADGADQQLLTSGVADPAWSPDGTRITFDNSVSRANLDVFTATSNGAGAVNLSNHLGNDFDPAWGPLFVPGPIDDPQFFVRQHYLDFLNRQPDTSGLFFWTNEITSCGTSTSCIEAKRVNVSAAFFLSIEFQETGYLVYRMYKTAYGNLAGTPVPVRLNEFLPDTQQIGQGVVVGVGNWQAQLENNKQMFAADFVSRSRFTSAYPTTMTPAQFVDALFINAGVSPSAMERTDAINEFGSATDTTDTAARARALRRVAENSTLAQQEFNRAFVLMQYFGYLRRNPNDAPDTDFAGYNFWLNKLNQVNGNFIDAEMVKSFLVSGEYRQRVGS